MKKNVTITDVNKFVDDELYGSWYKCPECGDTYIFNDFNYCPMCGCKIDWQISD